MEKKLIEKRVWDPDEYAYEIWQDEHGFYIAHVALPYSHKALVEELNRYYVDYIEYADKIDGEYLILDPMREPISKIRYRCKRVSNKMRGLRDHVRKMDIQKTLNK